MTQYVYFVKHAQSGQIKIGVSSDVKERMRTIKSTLRKDGPRVVDLQLLGIIEGDSILERKIHRQFNSLNIRGEWFEEMPELTDYIVDKAQADLHQIDLGQPSSDTWSLGDLADISFQVLRSELEEARKREVKLLAETLELQQQSKAAQQRTIYLETQLKERSQQIENKEHQLMEARKSAQQSYEQGFEDGFRNSRV